MDGAVNERIAQRGRGNTDDLFSERKFWLDYFNSLPGILRELNARKCISLKAGEATDNLGKIADTILNNK